MLKVLHGTIDANKAYLIKYCEHGNVYFHMTLIFSFVFTQCGSVAEYWHAHFLFISSSSLNELSWVEQPCSYKCGLPSIQCLVMADHPPCLRVHACLCMLEFIHSGVWLTGALACGLCLRTQIKAWPAADGRSVTVPASKQVSFPSASSLSQTVLRGRFKKICSSRAQTKIIFGLVCLCPSRLFSFFSLPQTVQRDKVLFQVGFKNMGALC